MTHEESSHYRRLLARYGGGLEDAMCVTYARGVDEDAFIRAFGGDPARTAPRRHGEPDDEIKPGLPMTLLVTRVGDWLVGIEDNGFQGSRPEVMRAASAGGTAVSAYWCVHASSRFSYRVNGQPVVSFDLSDAERRWGPEPEALGELMLGLPFGYGDESWVGLTLAERLTGVRLDEEILGRVFRRAILTPVPEDLIPEGREDDPALADPFVRAVVAEPTRDKLPAIIAFLARLVAGAGGVRDEPAVRDALALLANPNAAGPSDVAVLRRRLDGLAEGVRGDVQRGAAPLSRVHALQGVRDALGGNLGLAALGVGAAGRYVLRGDESLVAHVLGRCADRALRDGNRPR